MLIGGRIAGAAAGTQYGPEDRDLCLDVGIVVDSAGYPQP